MIFYRESLYRYTQYLHEKFELCRNLSFVPLGLSRYLHMKTSLNNNYTQSQFGTYQILFYIFSNPVLLYHNSIFCKTISNQMSCNIQITWDRGLGHISRTTIVYDQISILRPANDLLSTISEANRQYIYVIIVHKLIICNRNA